MLKRQLQVTVPKNTPFKRDVSGGMWQAWLSCYFVWSLDYGRRF